MKDKELLIKGENCIHYILESNGCIDWLIIYLKKKYAIISSFDLFRNKPCKDNLKRAKELYKRLLLLMGYKVKDIVVEENLQGSYIIRPII